MQRAPSLPCLPGFTFDARIGQTKFNKPQHFDKIHKGVYYLSEKLKCGIGGAPLPFSEHSRYPSIYPRGEVQVLPPWLAFDGQRLMFKAYFQETVQEQWQASFRIRVVVVSFFLEDGTIKISEPVVDNSGLEQGVLVRRQRIPMPDPVRYRYYDIVDLNVGQEPEFFGRVYKIVDCDNFTRRFLNRMGIPVSDPIDIPEDPYDKKRKPEVFSKKPNRKVDTLGKFLKYDRNVLRFYGYWDDRESLYGVIHYLELHYYLADDTIEIKENIPPNSGRDANGMFIKRMKIPKFFSRLDPIGTADPFTVLNVLGETTAQSYYIADCLDAGKLSRDCYKDADLIIGAHINVFGRKIVITDLDAYTKEYYRVKYGIDDFTPLEQPDAKNDTCNSIEKYIPPYNGFGSYEDSLGNCFTVMPKAPQVDFVKFYYHDKQGFDSRVLRFRAKMISNIPENKERQFIIRIFIMDDTISIFELARRNSGFSRCLFQKRMPVMLPGQDIYTNKKPKYYEPQHFYIGACLNLCEFHFQLTSADVYALRYMELNCVKFPKANIKLIMEKLREVLKPVYKEFIQEYSPVLTENDIQILEYKRLREALYKYFDDKITEHEIITVARHYSSHEKKEFLSREYVRRLVHTELIRLLWNDLDRLEEDIHHVDRARTGYLPRSELYTILRGCRIPLDVELQNSMLDHIFKNEEGKLNYCDLLQFMNVKINPVTPMPPVNVKSALWWASEKEPDCGAGINWCAFLKDLDIKENEPVPEVTVK